MTGDPARVRVPLQAVASNPGPDMEHPNQPRLDWQMWFAAHRSVAENAWFERLIHELLKGSPAVLALVAANPFPDRPPKYVRALLYDYRFADPDTYVRTGQWWVRRLEGLYFPQVTLADFPRSVPPETGRFRRSAEEVTGVSDSPAAVARRFAGVRGGMLNRHRSWDAGPSCAAKCPISMKTRWCPSQCTDFSRADPG